MNLGKKCDLRNNFNTKYQLLYTVYLWKISQTSKHISMKNVQLLMALEGRIGVTLNGRGVTLGTNKMFPFELVLL